MKKRLIPSLTLVLVLLSQALLGLMFENNTDHKAKYMFDVQTAKEDEKLSSRLKKFQNAEITPEELQRYLDIIENNTTHPFEEDVQVDSSLHLNTIKQEENWFMKLYNSWFGDETLQETSPQKGENNVTL